MLVKFLQTLTRIAFFFILLISTIFYAQDRGENFFELSLFSESTFDEGDLRIKTPVGVELVQTRNYCTYFPKGFARNNTHTGIWNAIPFLVLDIEMNKLRFGLIFEHRQVGILPESWVVSTMSSPGMPNLLCEIPATKTFLDFTQGSAQWRATVVLTEEQINILKIYAFTENDAEITVLHQFTDGSSRPYFISQSVLYYFQLLLSLYEDIRKKDGINTIGMSKNHIIGDFFQKDRNGGIIEEDRDYERETLPLPEEEDDETISSHDERAPVERKIFEKKSLSRKKKISPKSIEDTYDDFGEYEYY